MTGTLQELSADQIKAKAAAVDAAIAQLEDSLATYVASAVTLATEWRRTHGRAGPIQKMGRDAPPELANAASYAQSAVNRAVARAMERARSQNGDKRDV